MSGDQISADALIGRTIGGRFVPTKLLGEGGMGYVFKAIQQPTNREVALKILKEDYMRDETIRGRFLREAEVIAKMSHPNIVMLYDSGIEENPKVLFMAMEYLNGKPLADIVADELPKIDLDRIFVIMTGISAALAEAHKNGVIHRDLKPENVFLTRDHEGREHAKVLDFGFARMQEASKKLTVAGVAFGTPHYMSPEQAMGKLDITPAADIYAVGVMLYELICGDVPYNGNSAMEIMTKQVNTPTPDLVTRAGLTVPKGLKELVKHCMEKQPDKRPPDGNALLEALQRIRGGGPASTGASSSGIAPIAKDGTPAPNNKMLIYMAVGGVVLVIITVLITVLALG